MKKIYGLIKNSSERNYRVHEDFDELDCRIYFDLEECKNAFKSDIDDFLGWTFCDHTKEEIIADYNGEGNYNTGVEEYRESEDSFYISFDCCNFDGYYNLDIVTLEVDDNITKENISYYLVELMEEDRFVSCDIKVFDNKKDKDISLKNEINNFMSKINITLEQLEEKVNDYDDITDIELGENKYLENFIKNEDNGFIEYYQKDGKRNPSSSIQYYTYI